MLPIRSLNPSLKFIFNGLIVLFLAGWIVPVAYYGLTNSPPFWLPTPLLRKTNVSRLFYRESEAWQTYEIQIKASPGSSFQTVPESALFAMHPFGYRTRFQRIMSFSSATGRDELAQWIHRRLVDSGQPVSALRFVVFPAFVPASSTVQGHYRQAPSDSVSPDQVQVVAEYSFPKP